MKKGAGPDPLSDARSGRREIRSFVLREGRLTPAQARALETLWPRFGIDNDAFPLDVEGVFGRPGEVFLEIGFGNGAALLHAAERSPDDLFLGIEVHRPGVGSLLRGLEEGGLDNVRVLCADATRVLADRIAAERLAGLRLFFPDPWPKKRHHKRRIVQPPFVAEVHRVVQPGGQFHLATDWEPYKEHMIEVIEAHGGFRPLVGEGPCVPRPAWRPETRFERRGRRLGHGVWDLLYQRNGGNAAEGPWTPA